MKFPIETPESMKDWPFFNQTGGNVMAILFCLGAATLTVGLFGWFYYTETDRHDEAAAAGRMFLVGALLVILSVVCWHLFDWTADDYA